MLKPKIRKPQKKIKKGKHPVGKATKKVKLEPLSDKEEQLCCEFVADFAGNQTRAYMYVYPGSNYETAKSQAYRMFTKPHIKSRVAELQQERNKRLEISGDRVLSEIAKLAFYDPREFFDSDMRLKPINELDPDHAAIIAGIETLHNIVGDDKDGVVVLTKIKMADKGANLERLGKYFKLFTEKHEMGLDSKTAELILATLPPEYAKAVKEKLAAMKTTK